MTFELHVGQHALASSSGRSRSSMEGQGGHRGASYEKARRDERKTSCKRSQSWDGADGMGAQKPGRLYPVIQTKHLLIRTGISHTSPSS